MLLQAGYPTSYLINSIKALEVYQNTDPDPEKITHWTHSFFN